MSCEGCIMDLDDSSPHQACVPCGHVFHEDCLKEILRTRRDGNCPACGTRLEARAARKIFLELPAGENNGAQQQMREQIAALQNKVALAKSEVAKEQLRKQRAEADIAKYNSLITAAHASHEKKRDEFFRQVAYLRTPAHLRQPMFDPARKN